MNSNSGKMSYVLRTEGVSMAFGGVEVLHDVDFTLKKGEILALMGENGAGKSTLARIIAGVHQPKKGKIYLNERETVISNPLSAVKLGIAFIHQEPLAFPDLSVAENIFVGRYLKSDRVPFVSWNKMNEKAENLLSSLGLSINPKSKITNLSFADQQMIDVAAAISEKADILLMDEPTASLTPNEVDRLFEIMQRLKDQGTSIVFVNHRMEEVFEIAARIMVMRDGSLIGERLPKESSHDEIIKMMVGRELNTLFEKPEVNIEKQPYLRVEGLTVSGHFNDVSFEVCSGEIVGMAGLVGAGRSDVAQTIFGIYTPDKGTIYIKEKKTSIKAPHEAISKGIAYLPEDRQHQGLFMELSVEKNCTVAALDTCSKRGWIKKEKEREAIREYIQKLRIILRSAEQPVMELSGGNQQKVIISRWLLSDPEIIILDEPTRGIDIGAKAEVHRLIGELAARGIAILMISSELQEIISMSDRVIVMHEGKKITELEGEQIDSEKIMAAATGKREIEEVGA